MKNTRIAFASLLALSLAACSPDKTGNDAGTDPEVDVTSTTDASADDASPLDAMDPADAVITPDAGTVDDGDAADAMVLPDVDVMDADASDASADTDAVTKGDDAGDPDAGDQDAGTGPDPRPTCEGTDHTVDSDPAESRYPRVVYAGGEFGIVFQDDRAGANPGDNWELFFARVTMDGTVLGITRVTNDPAADTHPALAWDGTRYWISWARIGTDGSSYALMATTATLQGTGSVRVGEPVALSENSVGIDRPNVQAVPAGSGGGAAVTWQDARDGLDNWEIYYARLHAGTDAGTSSDAGAGNATLTTDGDVRVTHAPRLSAFPLLSWNTASHEFGLAWIDDRNGSGPVDQPNEDVYFARILPDGSRPAGSDDVQITHTSGRSLWPSLLYTGPGYVLSWAEEDVTPDLPHVYMTRFNAAGMRGADDQDRKLSSNPDDQGAWTSAAGWNGTEYTFVWEDQGHPQGDIGTRRLSPTLDDATPESFLQNDTHWSGYVNMTRGEGGYMVAWEDDRAGHRDVWFRWLGDSDCR